MKVENCTIAIGDGLVTVKRRGTRGTTVANILGTVEAAGIEVICLDRLVHGIFESELDGWQVGGAVTTLLSRPIGPRRSTDH